MNGLMLHRGGRVVDRAELDRIKAPPPTATWFPIAHSAVLDRVTSTLQEAGFAIRTTTLGLSPRGQRFFGTLDLNVPLATGVHLAVAVRNSIDQSFPIGFACGSRVFCCDNLSFTSEVIVSRKHTRFGEARFVEGISLAVKQLAQFSVAEGVRIGRMQKLPLKDEMASHLILRAFQEELISTRQLPDVIREWQHPTYEEFCERNLWSLANAFTTVLTPVAKSNAQRFAHISIRLCDMLSKAVDMSSAAEPHLTLPA